MPAKHGLQRPMLSLRDFVRQPYASLAATGTAALQSQEEITAGFGGLNLGHDLLSALSQQQLATPTEIQVRRGRGPKLTLTCTKAAAALSPLCRAELSHSCHRARRRRLACVPHRLRQDPGVPPSSGELVFLCLVAGVIKISACKVSHQVFLSFALLQQIQQLKAGEAEGDVTRPKRPRALVLGPTRELTDQILSVAKSLSHFAKFRSICLNGGKPGSLACLPPSHPYAELRVVPLLEYFV